MYHVYIALYHVHVYRPMEPGEWPPKNPWKGASMCPYGNSFKHKSSSQLGSEASHSHSASFSGSNSDAEGGLNDGTGHAEHDS